MGVLLAGVLVAAVAVAAPASAANEPPLTHTTVVAVKNHQTYTNTRVVLQSGETVTVRVTGSMTFGGGAGAATTPNGVTWGPACTGISDKQGRRAHWPGEGLNCWSLIGRIGTGAPFEIGTVKTFTADRDGTLLLGLNDNFVKDNHGHWTATITVAAPVPSKSHTTTYLLIGLLLLALVLLLLFWLWYRKRPKREKAAKPVPAMAAASATVPAHLLGLAAAEDAAAAEAPVAPPAAEEPELVAAPAVARPFAGPQADSIDVNIFEVEFSNGLKLRIGYNHFPEGTTVRWRVTQDRLPVAVGDFVAEGGGSTNHFETVTLGVKLDGRDTKPDGADVQFDWSINGVPFKYSVRRDPNC